MAIGYIFFLFSQLFKFYLIRPGLSPPQPLHDISLSLSSQVPNNLQIQEIDSVEDRLSLFEMPLLSN